MGNTLTITDIEPEVEDALLRRAAATGETVPDIARNMLRRSLAVPDPDAARRWRIENEEAIQAYNQRAEEVMRIMHGLSAAPIPDFGNSE